MEFIKNNKKYLIIVSIIVLLLILFGIVNLLNKKTYISTIKEDNNSKLPHINIENEVVNELNDRLESQYNEIINLNNDSYMTYEYSKNNNILSILIIKNVRLDEDYIMQEEYDTYNIDLKTKEFLGNNDIYQLYKIDKDEVESKIVSDLIEQYDSEIKDGYIVKEECDIDCYLEDRDYVSLDDNFNLYIKNNKVLGYLNIDNATLYYSNDNYPKINKEYSLN